MRVLEDEIVSSASDLNDFLGCPHRSALALRALRLGEAKPPDDPTLELIARKGGLHERAAFERLAAQGRNITTIADGDGSPHALFDAVIATRAAMERGDDVIYQGAFLHDGWSGRADFVERVALPSRLGAWSYEVADAKLAVREKSVFLVQLCVYARLVESVQGRLPPQVFALLGDGRRVAYDPERYVAYVDLARARYLASLGTLDPDAVPDKLGACAQCAWSERCEKRRRGVDHLSFVAGIRRTQIARLRDAGIETLAALAAAPAGAPEGVGADTFASLRRQAALQLAQRERGGEPSYQLLAPRERAGFALLPEPDPHDVYFDMEGDPLYEPGTGLEYLFGAYVHGEAPRFFDFWGETRDGERLAFERFIDWLTLHRREHPRAHVYHYAPYEKTALRKLALRHGTREDEVDALLRGEVLVDLYAVVRGGLVQSQESYSIKKLERLYGFGRHADVRKGDDSIVVFEQYLLDRDPQRRAAITAYNEEDCVSTRELHAWLLRLRREGIAGGAPDAWRPARDPAAPTEDELRAARDTDDLSRALVAASQPGTPLRLLAHALFYHKREDRPIWWKQFDRWEAAAETDFVDDDHEVLGGLVLAPEFAPFKVKPADKNRAHTYRYPEQHHKVRAGTYHDPHQGRDGKGYEVVGVDDDALLVRIKHRDDAPPPRALCEQGAIRTKEQQEALRRLAAAARDGTLHDRYPAAASILFREVPRIRGYAAGAAVQPELRDGIIDARDVAALAAGLDRSCLPVQGPPGTGKTYTGARVVAELLARGKRVGITAPSHRAIHNLLAAVEDAVIARGGAFRGVKKRGADEESAYVSPGGHPFIENVKQGESYGEYQLVAGTSWVHAKAELAQLDVLVIDEAGQVSLADALAMATNANAVVLLGDPLQLAQVSQGQHPEGAGASVLEHVLDGHATIAPERGVFLERSFRMHPAICEFISSMVYEKRLQAVDACARQRVDASAFAGAGLLYVPVEHDGNAQRSRAEADAVGELFGGLRNGTFTAADGSTRSLGVADILVVSPYNAQVSLLRRTLSARFGSGVRVGTVDKFQGQEAPVAIYSLAASSAEDAPRGADFLLEENRFNVAISRGRALSILVCSPRLLASPCTSVEQLRSAAAFCAFAQRAASEAVPV